VSITVVEGLFAHLTFSEQLKEIRESSIIVGAHGVGLSHLLFSRPQKTAVLELMSSYYMHPHFQFMSQWMGIEYHKIEMTSSEVDCSEMTRYIDQTFLGMLCKEGGIL
jgi:glycoprotein 2-beta-D-xylosyltransferase